MPLNNELIDSTVAEMPSNSIPLLVRNLNLANHLNKQYDELVRLREQQIKVMGAFILRQAKWITCLLPMLIASVIVNLYFANRFF